MAKEVSDYFGCKKPLMNVRGFLIVLLRRSYCPTLIFIIEAWLISSMLSSMSSFSPSPTLRSMVDLLVSSDPPSTLRSMVLSVAESDLVVLSSWLQAAIVRVRKRAEMTMVSFFIKLYKGNCIQFRFLVRLCKAPE